ncbi:MAG: nascent polypeptide-associated complex protein [Methanosarcinales archaeon]|nr:MAG: nascent polypeptide-associated complex protein [Methanosarcinales archaeon]
MMGMNPRKMKQMMKQMGIDVENIDNVEQVIIKTSEKNIVFNDATVSIMVVKGDKTYQITGTPHEVPRETEISEDDIKLVAEQTGATKEDAYKVLKHTDGDIAEAIIKLSE